MDLAIQIVNYKTKTYLSDLLKDLVSDLKNATFSYEINILDNDSGDQLDDLKKDFPQLPISIYYSKKNLGFGAGHNFLAQKTEADYLLILNADLKIIEKDSVTQLYSAINSDPDIDVLGPRLVKESGRTQVWDHGHFIPILPKIYMYWREDKNPCSVAYVSGAVFLIRKSSFDQVKGFDPKIFLYSEELDLCIRIQDTGGKIVYNPSVKVMHFGSVVAKKGRFMKDSMNYMIDKYYKGSIINIPLKIINNLTPYR